MGIVIWIIIFILILIIYQIFCIKNLIVPTKKRKIDIITITITTIVLLTITYFYSDMWHHYLIGILASIASVLNLYKSGITTKGFSFPAGYTGALVSNSNWNKIERVKISKSKHVIINFTRDIQFGPSYEYKLFFDTNNYKNIINILKKNLDSNKLIYCASK